MGNGPVLAQVDLDTLSVATTTFYVPSNSEMPLGETYPCRGPCGRGARFLTVTLGAVRTRETLGQSLGAARSRSWRAVASEHLFKVL